MCAKDTGSLAQFSSVQFSDIKVNRFNQNSHKRMFGFPKTDHALSFAGQINFVNGNSPPIRVLFLKGSSKKIEKKEKKKKKKNDHGNTRNCERILITNR